MPRLKFFQTNVGETKTPGTNISYSSLGGWIDGMFAIGQRKDSSGKYMAQDHHLRGLPVAYIEKCEVSELLEIAVQIIKQHQPPRGKRGDHHTTATLMNLNNQLARLRKESDFVTVDREYFKNHVDLAVAWRCNYVQFQVLLLLDSKGGQIEYDDKDYQGLTGQPGQTLRAMVDRGWLTGPRPKEKPRDWPWSISIAGYELLRRISIGLRPVERMSAAQTAALLKIGDGKSLYGVHIGTLTSLSSWGYIYGSGAGNMKVGTLTPVGLEALTFLRADIRFRQQAQHDSEHPAAGGAVSV